MTPTTHFVGQSTIFPLTGRSSQPEKPTALAHHITLEGGKATLDARLAPDYLDTFVKDGWRMACFAERQLYVDWLEERATFMTTAKPDRFD